MAAKPPAQNSVESVRERLREISEAFESKHPRGKDGRFRKKGA